MSEPYNKWSVLDPALALKQTEMSLPELAQISSGDSTKALFGDGSFKVPSGGGGGSNTITLTADTDIAAGTAVSINSSGHAVQTWGPAPNVANLATLLGGNGVAEPYFQAVLVLNASQSVIFDLGPSDAGNGAQPFSISSEVITAGVIDTQTPSKSPRSSTGSVNINQVAAALTGSLFIVAYQDPGNSNNITVAAGSIAANVITYGTPVQVAAQALGGNGTLQIFKLDASHFFIISQLNDGSLVANAGSVSGTTITLGAPQTIAVISTYDNFFASVLSSSAILISYNDSTASNIATLLVATVSGTALTLNATATVSGTAGPSAVTALSATSFGLIDNSATIYAGSISGTTISTGAGVEAGVGSSENLLFALGTSTLVNFGIGAPNFFSVSGTTVSKTSGGALLDNGLGGNPINFPAVLSSSMLMFSDGNFSIYEQDNTGLVSPPVKHFGLTGYWFYTLDATHALAVLGISTGANSPSTYAARVINAEAITPSGPVAFASSAVTSGNSGTFTTSGSVSGFSGLTVGTPYYVNGDGTLTTANTGHKAGVALSATELLSAA
jgi:hypothetical protein